MSVLAAPMTRPHPFSMCRTARLAMVARHVEREWEWLYAMGRHDCMTLALGAADILAGTSFLPRWKGGYSSPASALRRLREAGFTSLCDPLDEHFSRIPASFSRQGDVCVFSHAETGIPVSAEHYGLFTGSHFEARLASGRHRVDPSTIIACFRVE